MSQKYVTQKKGDNLERELKIALRRLFRINEFKKKIGSKKRLDLTSVSQSLQNYLQGLPIGLTLIYGPSGAGKSKLARTMASILSLEGHTVLYVIVENDVDAPTGSPEHLYIADFRRFLPSPQRTALQIKLLAQHINAEIVFIDSIAQIVESSNKAVWEADIRPIIFELSDWSRDEDIHLVAINQVRGDETRFAPAGGQAVRHASILTLLMFQTNPQLIWVAKRFNVPLGKYFLYIEKDKEGLAFSGYTFEVKYKDQSPILKPINIKTVKNEKREKDE